MSDPGPTISRSGHPAVFAGVAFALLGLWCWIVHQGGLAVAEPASTAGSGSAASLAGLVIIVIEALPLLAAWWLGAAGFGYALRQRGVAQLGVGMAAMLLLNYIAGFVIGFSGTIAWSLCGVGMVLLNMQVLRARQRRAAVLSPSLEGGVRGGWRGWLFAAVGGKPSHPPPAPPTREGGSTSPLGDVSWWWLIGIPGLAMLIVTACCPPGTVWRVEALGYDVLSYHLQIPREWITAPGPGRAGMVELEHNVYAYLPGLMEAAFAALMSMRGGSAIGSVYTCQLFHASFALLAAAAVGSLLRTYVKPGAAAAGGALVLLVPWVIVTGSMAYNEMVVVALAAVGLRLVAGSEPPCGRSAWAVGLLAGAATLAKLTAAFTVALPLGAVLVWRLIVAWRQGRSAKADASDDTQHLKSSFARRVLLPTAVCVVAGSAALLPYLARNAAWTGNPVFPFATQSLGLGHWDEARAARWSASHMPEDTAGQRWEAVWRQGLGNAGYGAWGGHETPPESNNVARFAVEGGLPVLWIAAGLGMGIGLFRRQTRWVSGILAFVLLGQFVWWLSMTHLQSRFLVVCVVPLCAGAGLLIGGAGRAKLGSVVNVGGLVALTLAGLLTVVALTTTWSQTTWLSAPDGQRVSAPLWVLVDGLPEPHGMGVMSDLPLNRLPAGSKIMVVGNNQSLFYIDRPMVYASAFDASPITPILESTNDPDEVARRLRADGITHLWLGYSEIDRLHATYGFDAAVTSDRLQRLVADWEHLGDPRSPTVLVAVPPGPPATPATPASISDPASAAAPGH